MNMLRGSKKLADALSDGKIEQKYLPVLNEDMVGYINMYSTKNRKALLTPNTPKTSHFDTFCLPKREAATSI